VRIACIPAPIGATRYGAAMPEQRPRPSRRSPGTLRPQPGRAHAPRVSTASLEAMADDVLLAPVAAARARIQNPRELSERVAFGKALWRELVIGFAAQLGELRLGFTQLAALYALADGGTTTIADLADTLNRSPSATSRLVDGLVRRRLLERREESEDRRMRSVWLTERGRALVAVVDRARADQFLAVVRPLPANERAIVAMGVAALATRAVSRRGRLIKQRPL
jgi:DNA-binding MarR family transcriptional regulator